MLLCSFTMSVLLVYRECVGIGGFAWVCMGDVYESVLVGVKMLWDVWYPSMCGGVVVGENC